LFAKLTWKLWNCGLGLDRGCFLCTRSELELSNADLLIVEVGFRHNELVISARGVLCWLSPLLDGVVLIAESGDCMVRAFSFRNLRLCCSMIFLLNLAFAVATLLVSICWSIDEDNHLLKKTGINYPLCHNFCK
jgi:hypothetical protein